MKTGAILEFKVAKMVDDMKQKAEEALSQIDSKQYITSFQKRVIRSVWKYGIAFCGKNVIIKRA